MPFSISWHTGGQATVHLLRCWLDHSSAPWGPSETGGSASGVRVGRTTLASSTGFGSVLCDQCFDNHLAGVNGGYPPSPNAVDHRANALFVALPPLRDCGWEVTWNVASFLERSPWRPGAGSRRTLPPPVASGHVG